MRPQNKSRSRNKNNSNNNNNNRRHMGNIVNRVFDSAGPEGKVRGTPQQIIEKYQSLARDAQLSNDRVAAENFSQHAEHYARMLGEALSAQAEMRANGEGGQGERQNSYDGEYGNEAPSQQYVPSNQAQTYDPPPPPRQAPQPEVFAADQSQPPMAAFAPIDDTDGGDLVATPENTGPVEAGQTRSRRSRGRGPRSGGEGPAAAEVPATGD